VRRRLTRGDFQPALIAGLLLSAGGSGATKTMEQHDVAGALALDLGPVELASLDELADDDIIITSTSVGAPGFADPVLSLRDYIDAANLLVAEVGRKPAGVICGHVPGFNAWLVSAALGIPYIDAAANGRGHPTVEMGGMGLASRPEFPIIQVCTGGGTNRTARLTVVARGHITASSSIMRCASVQNGGLIASARGPLTAAFVRENGAPGAVSFQIELGHAMLAVDGAARARAAAAFLKGDVVIAGRVVANDVGFAEGFDLGRITVHGPEGDVVLGIYNEFMTAERNGRRLATFPDLIASLDPNTGDPVAISQLPVGRDVAIVLAHRSGFPVGKGAMDPAVFPKVERAMGTALFRFLKT
jgi:uncharacterized protein